MSLNLDVRRLGPSVLSAFGARKVWAGERTTLAAAVLHVDMAESASDAELAALPPSLLAALDDIVAQGARPSELLVAMHRAAVESGRYYSAVAVVIAGTTAVISGVGRCSASSASGQVFGPDVLQSPETPAILTRALGAARFGAPDETTVDLDHGIAIALGGDLPANWQEGLGALIPATDESIRGGIAVVLSPASWLNQSERAGTSVDL